MQLVKIKQTLTSIYIAVFIISIGFLLITLGLTGKLNQLPAIVFVLVGALVAAIIHGAIYAIRNTRKVKEEKITGEKDIFHKVGQAVYLYEIIKSIIFGLIVVAVAIFAFVIGIKNLSQNQVSIGRDLIWIILGFAAYWIILFPILRKLKGQSLKLMPTYTLNRDGITINPRIIGNKELRFEIKFSEIEELREMTYYESQMYLENIGPNVNIAIERTKDLYNMNKKRPDTYIMNQGGGKTLLLKGKKLFYLITFGTKDVSDLTTAYKNYRESKL